jgi:4a-hydroxytetrahydrobiopterin dehydratase
MNALLQKHCVPCEGGVPKLSASIVKTLLLDIPGWEVDEACAHLSRRWKFKNFNEAMAFVNAVARLSEEENHHPDFAIHYSRVTLTLWTHAITGLSQNDFILAAKINALN